jgi:uncharacterized protein YdgA (DUF945 family)
MTAFDRALAQMSTEQILELYEATVQGRMATSPLEQLEAAYRKEQTKAFMARIKALPTEELLKVWLQLTLGKSSDEILQQLGPP